MPHVASPDLWAVARLEWETTNVSYTDIARKLGVAVPTVHIRSRREMWTRADIDRVNFTPQQLVDIGIQALVRAASQSDDTASAVKAAGMLLDRALGKVVAEQTTPLLAKPEEAAADVWPEWISARRLAYQLELDKEPEPAETSLPPAEPVIDAPASAVEPPAPSREPQRPALHSVPHPLAPRFWSGISTPDHQT